MPSAFDPQFCDCMAIAVDSAVAMSVEDGVLDKETATAFEVLPGRYWLLGYQDAEHREPIYKQEKTTDPDSGHCISEHDALGGVSVRVSHQIGLRRADTP